MTLDNIKNEIFEARNIVILTHEEYKQMRKALYKGRKILKEKRKVFRKELKENKEKDNQIKKDLKKYRREVEIFKENLGLPEEPKPEAEEEKVEDDVSEKSNK